MHLLFQPMAFIASLYLLSEGGAGENLAFNPAVLVASLYVSRWPHSWDIR